MYSVEDVANEMLYHTASVLEFGNYALIKVNFVVFFAVITP